MSEAIQLLIATLLVLAVLGTLLAPLLVKLLEYRLPLLDKIPLLRDWNHPMSIGQYVWSFLMFHVVAILSLALAAHFQDLLPGNPGAFAGFSWDLAFNTAISFATNTNWQAYSGESMISPLIQTLGLAVHNFTCVAAGISVALVLLRVLSGRTKNGIGNYWQDMLLGTVLLIVLCVPIAVYFVSQGVPQTFDIAHVVQTMAGTHQVQVGGMVASQEAIKMLGTNGGGYFNANSAHPLENPTAWTNWVQILSILTLGATFCFAYGRAIMDRRQGIALFVVMSLMFGGAFLGLNAIEGSSISAYQGINIDQSASENSPGGNMEGKEVRFGQTASNLFVAATTSASCGAVANMHASMQPLSWLFPIVLMQTGEVIFGGVGSGFTGMMLYVFLAVFIAGLMVGKNPSFQGYRIGVGEMRWVAAGLMIPSALILIGTAWAAISVDGQKGVLQAMNGGFSEILYAFTSASNNNGSAMAGLSANTPFYNWALGACMLLGRLGSLLPVVYLAGRFMRQRKRTANTEALPTHGPTFNLLLIGTIILVGALTFVPVLLLGPVATHLLGQ